jgi:hypothetical protein
MLTNVKAMRKAVMVWTLRLPMGVVGPAALSDVLVIWKCSLVLMFELCPDTLFATAYNQSSLPYELCATHCWSIWKSLRLMVGSLVWQAVDCNIFRRE